MSTYELIYLYNIPFLRKAGDSKLYYYDARHIGDASEPIAIGNDVEGVPTLVPDWKKRIEHRVVAWRSTLVPSERGTIQARAPKPVKPKRTVSKATGAAGNAAGSGETGAAETRTTDATTDATANVVIMPMPGPASPKKRRTVVRKNAP